MEFKDKLKELRIANNLTQEALAYKLKVSRSTIAKWEAGLGIPLEYSIDDLCEAFNCTKDELFPNKYSEKLLIDKNIKINRKNIIIGIMIFLLFTLILIVSLTMIIKSVKRNNFDKYIPTCTDFQLYNDQNNLGVIDEKYCLKVGESYKFSFILEINKKVFNYYSGIELRINDYRAYILDETIYGIYPDKIFIMYTGEFLMKYQVEQVKIDKLNIEYFYEGDRIIKKCNTENNIIDINSIYSDPIIVEFKIGNKLIYEVNCEKGDMLYNIFDEITINTQVYKYFESLGIDKLKYISYYDDENQKYKSEPLIDNTVINIKVELPDSIKPEIKIVDEGNNFLFDFNTIKYLEINGNKTALFDYKILNSSDNIKIHSDELYEILLPGSSYLEIEYDLGFYKETAIFNFEVSDITWVHIRSTQYIDAVEAKYNYETKELELNENKLNSIKYWYEYENKIFLEKGIERKFIRFEQISKLQYIAIFEYSKMIDVPNIYININGQKYNLNDLNNSNEAIEVKRNSNDMGTFSYEHSGNYGHIGYMIKCDGEKGYYNQKFYKEGNVTLYIYFIIHMDGVDYHLEPFKINFKVVN